ncbi:ribosome maturation factor RimM [Chitinimonas sp.]|uniref:ribosome maturation factor RimM n=1 Tax=Chitinimonas sp. TaxID=1934313 RepID=UPI0035B4F656
MKSADPKPARAQPIDPSAGVPADLVPMGFVAGAFGIRGWVKVVASTEFSDSLLDYETWWLGRDGQWRAYQVEDSNVQPKQLSVKLAGISDRDIAFAMKGMTVAVPRSQMPAAAEGEYYWADLIGLAVVNRQGERLGVVEQLLETGANDVLVVKDGAVERLVPFVGPVVDTVDLAARQITVDWGLDY